MNCTLFYRFTSVPIGHCSITCKYSYSAGSSVYYSCTFSALFPNYLLQLSGFLYFCADSQPPGVAPCKRSSPAPLHSGQLLPGWLKVIGAFNWHSASEGICSDLQLSILLWGQKCSLEPATHLVPINLSVFSSGIDIFPHILVFMIRIIFLFHMFF